MRFHRNTIWLIPLITFITYPLWSKPVGHFLSPPAAVDSSTKSHQNDNRNFNMDMVKILQNQNGQKTALVKAHKARTSEDDPELFLMELVSAELFDTEGNVTNILANNGTYSTKSKILTLRGDVVINRVLDKQFLYTDLLLYDSEQRRVNCPGKTRLEAEDVEIDGGSLSYDIKTQTYVIDKKVRCTIRGFKRP